LCRCIDEHGGDDERAEVIALSRFVDSYAFDRRGRHPVDLCDAEQVVDARAGDELQAAPLLGCASILPGSATSVENLGARR
jgi:hypothetical protein